MGLAGSQENLLIFNLCALKFLYKTIFQKQKIFHKTNQNRIKNQFKIFQTGWKLTKRFYF